MSNRLQRVVPIIVMLSIFAVALFTLHKLTSELHLRDLLASIAQVPAATLLAAAGCTTLSYSILTLYDVLALRYLNRSLPYRHVAVTSFISYAIGQNVGAGVLSGGAVRYRLYSLAGLGAPEIALIVVFATLTFQLGAGVLIGLSLIGESSLASKALPVHPGLLASAGGAILLAILAWIVLSAVRQTPLTIRGWQIPMPPVRMTLAQIVVACADLMAASAVLYLLLPQDPNLSFIAFLGLYMVALVAGVVSTVPGGLGVFETMMLLLLPGVSPPELLGALLLYRLIYYAVPFAIAILLMSASELRLHQKGVGQAWQWLRRALGSVVPQAMSLLCFGAGAILLVSGATPAIEDRIEVLQRLLPLSVVELSHLVGSAIGVGLLILARGLYFRLDAAWYLMVWFLSAGIVVSLLKGLDYEEALLLLMVLLPLIASRREFYRPASLLAESLTPRWLAMVAMTIAASIWIGMLAHRHVTYQDELWWQFAFDASAPRMMRASLVAIITVGAVAALQLLRPRHGISTLPNAGELERARAITSSSGNTSGNLALLGDKSLLFSESGQSFLMYAVSGRSWISMGDPIGVEEEFSELIWRFRELCDRQGGRCVFYEVRAESLQLYVDAGMSLSKLGEEARVALAQFSLEGKDRAEFRQASNKAVREGASFRVVPAAEVAAILPRLRQISDEWLAEKSAAEKGFSLGFFKDSYISQCPCAVVEKKGQIVAFANLWAGDNREELSVDLMRYSCAAPRGMMDFLFTQIMLWGKAQGYVWFSLGMAPLSGLEDNRLAPTWHKIGRLVFRYGEDFYNFEGLRHYKDKFRPEWRPRYLAVQSGLALPAVLLDVTALISGGLAKTVGGVGKRAG